MLDKQQVADGLHPTSTFTNTYILRCEIPGGESAETAVTLPPTPSSEAALLAALPKNDSQFLYGTVVTLAKICHGKRIACEFTETTNDRSRIVQEPGFVARRPGQHQLRVRVLLRSAYGTNSTDLATHKLDSAATKASTGTRELVLAEASVTFDVLTPEIVLTPAMGSHVQAGEVDVTVDCLEATNTNTNVTVERLTSWPFKNRTMKPNANGRYDLPEGVYEARGTCTLVKGRRPYLSAATRFAVLDGIDDDLPLFDDDLMLRIPLAPKMKRSYETFAVPTSDVDATKP